MLEKELLRVCIMNIRSILILLPQLISSNMKELSTIASVKGYDSALCMSLFGDDVSIDVYNNLIDSVHEKIGYFMNIII